MVKNKKHWNGRFVVGITTVFVAGVLLGDRWTDSGKCGRRAMAQESSNRPAPSPDHWLSSSQEERRSQLERHLRGLDVAMMEIGHRFEQLCSATQDRNWPLAQYQIEKIDLVLRLALQRRPKRAASAKPFLTETIPFVKKAIVEASGGSGRDILPQAMKRLRMDCMKCHVKENVPHFVVSIPVE